MIEVKRASPCIFRSRTQAGVSVTARRPTVMAAFVPVEYFADTAVRDLQTPTDLTRTHALQSHLKDLHSQVVGQRATVGEHPAVLIHRFTACTATDQHDIGYVTQCSASCFVTERINYTAVQKNPYPCYIFE